MKFFDLDKYIFDKKITFGPEWNYITAGKEWAPKAFQTYLLLMSIQAIACTQVYLRFRPGFKHLIGTYTDGYFKTSYDPRDFSVISKKIIEETKNNPAWIQSYFKEFEKQTHDLTVLSKKIYFSKQEKDIKAIKKQFLSLLESAVAAQSYGYLTEAFTITAGEYWVTKRIKELLPDITDKEIEILLTPSNKSFLTKFNELLSKADPEDDYDRIIEEFYFVKGSYFTFPILERGDLKREKKSIVMNRKDKGNKIDKDKIIKRSKKYAELKNFIEVIEFCIHIQDERKANVLKINYAINKLAKVLSGKIGLSAEQILSLTPHEFVNLKSEELDQKFGEFINQRNKKSAWLFLPNQYLITTDESVFSAIGKLFKENLVEIKGFVASRGLVKGRAKIILSENDFHKIEVGDILVTSMTRPEFIPIMRKASAFVTDEGGITCHAAIVSREMNKPCLIATKVATQILKDGDLVEVDANRGVVKILK